jgi:hypothetical protein
MYFERPTQHGYIALMSAVIISLILTGMTFSLSGSGYFSRYNVLNSEYKRVSLGLAESCVNSALMKISQDYMYMPAAMGDSVNVGTQNCLIKSVTYGPEIAGRKAAYIAAQADYQGAFSNIKVSATIASTTYSNASRATLYVIVHVVNDSGGTKQASDITLEVFSGLNPAPAGPFQGSESGTVFTLNASPSVSITIPPLVGYTQAPLPPECTSAISAGQTKTCVVTYNDNSNTANITVIANIKNNDGGTKGPSDFKLYLNGAEVVPGQSYVRAPGTYVVSGSSVSGYNSSPWGYDCDSGGNVTLASGDSKTCKINYDDITPPAPACADTVVMIDRTGSLSTSDLAAERAATKGLLDLYAKIPNPPQVGIGRFGGASGSNADIIPGGELTVNYGTSSLASSTALLSPSVLAAPVLWSNSLGGTQAQSDGQYAFSSTFGQAEKFKNFGINIPGGATISGVEVHIGGKSVSAPTVTNTANLYPTFAGAPNSNQWTGTTTTNAQKVVAMGTNDNDASYLSSGTNNNSQVFIIQNASLPPGATVNSVTLYALARNTSVGATMRLRVENAGNTVSSTSAQFSPSAAYSPLSWTMNVNPITGLPWTSAEVSAWPVRFGMMKTNTNVARVSELYVVVNYSYTPAALAPVKVDMSFNNGTNWSSSTSIFLPETDSSFVLGGSKDNWGRSWGGNDFTNGNFILRLTNNATSGNTVSIDYLRVRVHYVSATGLYAAIDGNLVTTSSGGTDIGSGINVGYGEVSGIRHDVSKAKVMIILSDGLPTVPSNSSSTVLAASDSAKQNGTSLYFLHFGSGSGNDLSAKIASGTTTVPGHQNGSKNDAGTANGNVSQANADKENNDGDNFFISPTFDQLQAIFQQVGTAVCPAAGAASVPPPTTGNVYVVTQVINDNGGFKLPSDFTMSATGINASPAAPFSGSSTPGVLVSFSPGAYNITETSLGGYTSSPGIGCSGVIAGGDNFTCVFTNNDNAPPPPPPPPPPPGIDIGPWVEASTTSPGP